ncbi:hypothetical protein BVC80_1413g21 [Macleaya cordata]|uniref:Proline-rich family protein n=1 Tax=Macleaya cordata TaxID=56857 RepID=A0A200R7U7_MACCD|nr:hypothetical protein BVC80_1413g21 [Macleaya cordata]
MACASQSMISANTCVFPCSQNKFLKRLQNVKPNGHLYTIRASSSSEAEDGCNDEECAPDKEVGKVSMEWLAVEKTKVVGSYPPRKKGWTGYVEKDTAGQTNIYSVEPAVYVAESAISSGTAGTSSDGAENTAAIVAGLAIISIAAASSVLIQVSKNKPPPVQTLEYSGPSLSYYINKFTPPETVEASTAIEPDSTLTTLESSAPEVSANQVESNHETSPISNSTSAS